MLSPIEKSQFYTWIRIEITVLPICPCWILWAYDRYTLRKKSLTIIFQIDEQFFFFKNWNFKIERWFKYLNSMDVEREAHYNKKLLECRPTISNFYNCWLFKATWVAKFQIKPIIVREGVSALSGSRDHLFCVYQ